MRKAKIITQFKSNMAPSGQMAIRNQFWTWTQWRSPACSEESAEESDPGIRIREPKYVANKSHAIEMSIEFY